MHCCSPSYIIGVCVYVVTVLLGYSSLVTSTRHLANHTVMDDSRFSHVASDPRFKVIVP